MFEERIPFFLSEKYVLHFKGKKKKILAKRGLLDARTEFTLRYNNQKGYLKIKKKEVFYTTFKGFLSGIKIELKHLSGEITIQKEGVTYEFIFQEGLITGIFIENRNVGVIMQKSKVNFGFEKYYGFVEDIVPKSVLVIFLILFNRIYSKEGYITYSYKGFVSIKPRLKCDSELIKRLNEIDQS